MMEKPLDQLFKKTSSLKMSIRGWSINGCPQRDLLRKKCPYLELFWSAFSCIRTEYREIRSISPYSVQKRKNGDQNNSEYGHFYAVINMEILLIKNQT